MKLSRLAVIGATAGAAAVLGISTAAMATLRRPSRAGRTPPPQRPTWPCSLQALASKVGLRLWAGGASHLGTPALTAITAGQFWVLSPGKRHEVAGGRAHSRPVRLDRRRQPESTTAQADPPARARAHAHVCRDKLPDWLTTGVADGSISNAQARGLVHQHITTEVSRYKGKRWRWDVANEFFSNTFDCDTAAPRAASTGGETPGCPPGVRSWSRTRAGGPLQPTSTRCCATTTSTSPARTATLPSTRPSTISWRTSKAPGVPIDCLVEHFTGHPVQGVRTRFQQDLQGYAELHLKVAVTEAERPHVASPPTPARCRPTTRRRCAQPYEFGQDHQGVPLGQELHLVHDLGLRATPSRGFPASSRARDAPTFTT